MKKIVLLAVALVTMTNVQAENRNDRNQQIQVENKMKPRHHFMIDRRHQKEGNPVEFITERMAKELNLNDAQKAQVLELNKKYTDMFRGPGHHGHRPPMKGQGFSGKGEQKPPQMDNGQAPAMPNPDKAPQDSKKKPDFDKKPDMKEMKAKREAYDKELKTILTEDQYNKYQEQQKERMEKMKEHHHKASEIEKMRN